MKTKIQVLLTISIILGIMIFSSSSFSQELTPYLKVIGQPSFNLRILEYELKEIRYDISNLVEKLENKDVLYNFYSINLKFYNNRSLLKELRKITAIYRPENVSEKGAIESMSSLLDDIHTKEMQFRKKSIPIFLKWFQNQLNQLDGLDVNQPPNLSACLLLLTQMDHILSKRIKGSESLTQDDLKENDTAQMKVAEKQEPAGKEPPAETLAQDSQPKEPPALEGKQAEVYIIKLEKYKKKLGEFENTLRQRGQKILEIVEKGADATFQKISHFIRQGYSREAELQFESKDLEFAFQDIFEYGKLLFEIRNRSTKSEVLGDKSQWNILSQLPITDRMLKKQEIIYYSVIIEKISEEVEEIKDGWVNKIQEAENQCSEIQGEIQKIQKILSDLSGLSCLVLDEQSAIITKKIIGQKDLISEPEKLQKLGKIIELYSQQKLLKLWRKNSGVSARLYLIARIRTIGRGLYDVSEIIKKKKMMAVKTGMLLDAINELRDAFNCPPPDTEAANTG